jgi:glycyl-tRNA synthetase beta chain
MGLLAQRLRGALIEDGISYDTVDAALAAGADDLLDAAARARALWTLRDRPAFAQVYRAYDRAARILPGEFAGEVREELITAGSERELLEAVRRLQALDVLRGARAAQDRRPGTPLEALAGRYADALGHLAALAGPVDRLFDDVLVMDPDPAVRANRLALLAGVVNLIRPIADLSRLVVGEGKPLAAS